MQELFTIGYEKSPQHGLLATLREHEVETLVDIRQLPLSRKPGFSKTPLTAALAEQGIRYVHVRALGTPPDVRARRKINHDQAAFREGFLDYLATQDEAMTALVERVERERCCLLCYEADYRECHRLLVAERVVEIAGDALTVTHLAIGAP